MSKKLDQFDLAGMVNFLLLEPCAIDDIDTYESFVRDISEVVTKYCGGVVEMVEMVTDEDGEFTEDIDIVLGINDQVPRDGGIYNDWGTDVDWFNGAELPSVEV